MLGLNSLLADLLAKIFSCQIEFSDVIQRLVVNCVLRLRRNTHWQEGTSFDNLLSHAGLGHMGKGGLYVTPPLEDCLTGLTGSSTRAGTVGTDLQLIGGSVADCQTLT